MRLVYATFGCKGIGHSVCTQDFASRMFCIFNAQQQIQTHNKIKYNSPTMFIKIKFQVERRTEITLVSRPD